MGTRNQDRTRVPGTTSAAELPLDHLCHPRPPRVSQPHPGGCLRRPRRPWSSSGHRGEEAPTPAQLCLPGQLTARTDGTAAHRLMISAWPLPALDNERGAADGPQTLQGQGRLSHNSTAPETTDPDLTDQRIKK